MAKPFKTALGIALVAGVAALAFAGWCRSRAHSPPLKVFSRSPQRVMGTSCHLRAVAAFDQTDRAEDALHRAEQCLRDLEAQMSVHLADSRLSRFNAAPPEQPDPLTPDILAVLSEARKVWQASDGAFDVTVYPLVQLWAQAEKDDREPDAGRLAQALTQVGMDNLRLDRSGATKLVEGVRVDLGGIAKGYAVDRAATALLAERMRGGMVNLGGNIRCFGATQERQPWPVHIQHPFRKDAVCGTMLLRDAAVATSGDYNRFYVVAGRHYSHILNPRTGQSVAGVPSVTVVSLPTEKGPPSACLADGWSTALSVLGPEGLKRLKDQPGVEALMILGTPDRPEIKMTAGFAELLAPGSRVNLD